MNASLDKSGPAGKRAAVGLSQVETKALSTNKTLQHMAHSSCLTISGFLLLNAYSLLRANPRQPKSMGSESDSIDSSISKKHQPHVSQSSVAIIGNT
ncbi:hypothetical protein [Paraferrimonas sp. SM1919]|uniref:hypothetical protein n=1 Tax=Paraferrimonas sp. SM1919 TaxID=2662263 RepID=UPI0013D60BCA|nr:hypothetical protein [Paraferrimonas sp. SM1919]